MKYIRTKDGRLGKFYQEQSFTIICSLGCIDKKDVLNQADTIEELCDEFVLVDREYSQDFYINHYYDEIIEIYKEEIERCKKPFVYEIKPRILYGAIWTDKGLIYVAKMNEKGELELL